MVTFEGIERGTLEYVKAWRDRFAPGVEVVDELPDGWKVCKGASHCPTGAVWINNGKSRFSRPYGYEHKLMYVGG